MPDDKCFLTNSSFRPFSSYSNDGSLFCTFFVLSLFQIFLILSIRQVLCVLGHIFSTALASLYPLQYTIFFAMLVLSPYWFPLPFALCLKREHSITPPLPQFSAFPPLCGGQQSDPLCFALVWCAFKGSAFQRNGPEFRPPAASHRGNRQFTHGSVEGLKQ